MRPYQRKPDPFGSVKSLIGVDDVFNRQFDAPTAAPEPNKLTEAPFNRLVFHLDRLNDLNSAIPVDRVLFELLQRKTPPFSDEKVTRQPVSLELMGDFGALVTINLWAIPIFFDGVMAYILYAADEENLESLQLHRNPTRPSEYDITSL